MIGPYPSYQLPPQVQALANRQPVTGQPVNPALANAGVQQVPVAPWQLSQRGLTQQQMAAVSGSGPGMMPEAAADVQQQQFLAGAAHGLAGGLRVAPPANAVDPRIPPQVAALANRYAAPQLPGVQQPASSVAVNPVGNPTRTVGMDLGQPAAQQRPVFDPYRMSGPFRNF